MFFWLCLTSQYPTFYLISYSVYRELL